jgi:hypothetical protein
LGQAALPDDVVKQIKARTRRLMYKTRKLVLNVLIYVLTAEKALQHLLTALFFLVYIPAIGTPDIGPTFNISNGVMAILNLGYFVLFVVGMAGKAKEQKWAIWLIVFLAALDIVLEFVFHGFFFITVSVIVSTILIVVSIVWRRYR